MVIQRIQTLWLLISAILLAVFAFTTFGTAGDASLCACQVPAVMVIALATAALTLVDIFLFKNLNLQIRVAQMCILLVVATVATALISIYVTFEGSANWVGGVTLPILAGVLCFLAVKGMKHDRSLLHSSDRLR
ncbi:MAG: DUF4293 family protein [Muribaculaceae bacterium]